MFADAVLSGSFTTPASGNSPQYLQLPFVPDVFEIWIQGDSSGDNWGNDSAGVIYAFWQSGMASGSALTYQGASGPVASPVFLSSNGITPVVSQANLFGPQYSGSAISKASPAVMTLTDSGVYQTGAVVQIESTTGALQFSGIPWYLTQDNGTTTYYLGTSSNKFDSSGFAAAATNVVVQQLLYPEAFSPSISYIVKLTTGSSTSIVTSAPHGLSVGDYVRLVIPSPWGSTQISGQQGQVTAVSDITAFTVNINSSAASAFAFPTSAQAAAGVSWPQVIPFGDQSSAFDLSSQDNNFQGVIIGNSSSEGDAILYENSALVLWKAQKSARVYSSLVS